MQEYTGTGGISVGGCIDLGWAKYLSLRFGPGYTAYLRSDASQGRLEKLSIKRVDLLGDARTYFSIIPLYIDSYDIPYNDEELCFESEAFALATRYYSKRLADIYSLLAHC